MATNWRTPSWFYEKVAAARGGFAVDAAADTSNHLCERWYGPGSPLAEDALEVSDWLTPAFCNPPYVGGAEWRRWLDHFQRQAAQGNEVIALLPAATSTLWWRDGVLLARADVLFITGRLPFTTPEMTKKSAPNHASALVLYGPMSSGQVGWIDLVRFMPQEEQLVTEAS